MIHIFHIYLDSHSCQMKSIYKFILRVVYYLNSLLYLSEPWSYDALHISRAIKFSVESRIGIYHLCLVA